MNPYADLLQKQLDEAKKQHDENKRHWVIGPMVEVRKVKGFRYKYEIRMKAQRNDGQAYFVQESHDLEKIGKPATKRRDVQKLLLPVVEAMNKALDTFLDEKCVCIHGGALVCEVKHARDTA